MSEAYAVINGVRHWVRTVGDLRAATPLVVVHGGPGGFIYDFERLTGPDLERHSPVVYYEQRGSGRSDPPDDEQYSIPLLVDDLEELRRHLDLPRIVLLGISFGGDLAAEYTVAHPDRVAELILQGTGLTARGAPSPWVSGFEAVATDKALRTAIRAAQERSGPSSVWDVVDRKTTDRFLFHRPGVATLVRDLWERSGLVNMGAMDAALAAQPPRTRPLVDELAEVDVAVLVLIGLWDRNAGVDGPRDLATRLPRAELRVFEDSAHFPNVEETTRYVGEVARFLVERRIPRTR
ncbi:alpha/beta fold hydrolase [Kribbella sp. NPDC048928]|uniref:alpha/beta fold hydrolase n=1 Tax=Kribbella sp. NPDC048928 TaxID=3364111 RepID=UPI00371C9933